MMMMMMMMSKLQFACDSSTTELLLTNIESHGLLIEKLPVRTVQSRIAYFGPGHIGLVIRESDIGNTIG